MRVELLFNIVTFKTCCSVISGLLDLLGKAGIDSYNFLFTWICHSSITDQHFTGIDYVYDGCLITIGYIYDVCLIRIDYIYDGCLIRIDYIYDGCLIRIDYIYDGCLIRIDYIYDGCLKRSNGRFGRGGRIVVGFMTTPVVSSNPAQARCTPYNIM
jgi:hypothetical protein